MELDELRQQAACLREFGAELSCDWLKAAFYAAADECDAEARLMARLNEAA